MITIRFCALTFAIFLVTLTAASLAFTNMSMTKDTLLFSFHCNTQQLRKAMGDAFNSNLMTNQLDKIAEDSKRTKYSVKMDKYAKPPWACITTHQWIDLGMDHYPRFVRTSYCPPSRCWFGMFTCKGKPFQITVLRRKASNGTELETTEDPCLVDRHPDLASDNGKLWEIKTVVVTLCCSCTL